METKIDLAKLAEVASFQISDICCSGENNLVCVSSFKGHVIGLKWNGVKFEKVFLTRPFKTPIRKMDFSCSGRYIICSSSDGRLCLIKSENGKIKMKIDGLSSSKAPFGAFVSMDSVDRLFAAGNDDGDVLFIDLEKPDEPVTKKYEDFDDQVSDMLFIPYKKTLICSSGDGTLLVIDTKKNKIISQTESFDDEISCLSAVKSGSKILCATGMGFINIYGYNYWGVVEDRIAQHPGTINCMVAENFEGNIMFTGCSDGVIRTLTIHPNSIKGELFKLDDSVEKLQLFEYSMDSTNQRFLLASTCADSILNVIDLKDLDKICTGSVQISKKRKIEQNDPQKGARQTFFAELE